MSFREPALPLRDILDAIDMIQQFVAGMDFDAFRLDVKTVAAVEPKLQLISEAAIRLGDHAEVLCPEQPWRNIRGLGNWLRHQYDRLDVETIWQTVQVDMPSLRAAAARSLAQTGSP